MKFLQGYKNNRYWGDNILEAVYYSLCGKRLRSKADWDADVDEVTSRDAQCTCYDLRYFESDCLYCAEEDARDERAYAEIMAHNRVLDGGQ